MGDSAMTVTSGEGSSSRSAAPGSSGRSDTVTIRMPANSAYVSVLRTTTAGLAARLSFTIDDIEDLRIAVDEASALVLSQAAPDAELSCTFDLGQDALGITVRVPSTSGTVPDRDSFGWTVLSALAGGADAGYQDGQLWITLHKQRDALVD